MSCNNCNNNELLNNTGSNIPTGNIEYDGIDFTCTTDPSLDTVTTDSLNTVLLRLFNAVCEDGGCCLSTVTYETLSTSIAESTLIPNSVYRFPYSTQHLLNGSSSEYNYTTTHHDPGTGIKNTFTPETEYLLARAVSTSEIAVEVYSESHPRDIIYYDHSLNRTEDNLQDRPGFITFRHDPDNDVSAHFDFRNVLHRRWDLDVKKDRDTDYRSVLNYDSASSYNHDLGYKNSNPLPSSGSVPAFANYNSAGNSTLGILSTTNETGATPTAYRDFKTFVSYDEELWFVNASSKEKPRFKNVHIKKSEAISRVLGSASGAPIELSSGGVVGSPYPSLANVVFFTRSAENVSVGQNASGITFTGRTIREINIGHNNENIIIGGTYGKPDYTNPLEPNATGFNEDIEIGNNNRNVMIADNNRTLKIGHSNIGITFSRYCFNVEIGNHNTKTYFDLVFSSSIKDWNENVETSNSGGLRVGSTNKDVNIVNSGGGSDSFIRTKNIPDGFTSSILESSFIQPSINISNTNDNVFIANSNSIDIGDKASGVIFMLSSKIEIGDKASNVSFYSSGNITTGNNLVSAEFNNAFYVNLKNNCAIIKIINAFWVNAGDNFTNSVVAYGCQDVEIGSVCSSLFISSNYKVKLGQGLSNITSRNASYGEIKSQSQNIYLESSANFSIGTNCTNVVLNTSNIKLDPSLGTSSYFSTVFPYEWATNESRVTTITGRAIIAGNSSNPILSTEVTQSIGTFIGYGITTEPSNNTVGDMCSNVFIVSSEGNKIKDSCNNIFIGTDSMVSYALNFVSGLSDGAGSTPAYTIPTLTALVTANTGGNNNKNEIGNNAQEVRFYGTLKNENEIASNSPGITVGGARVFINNKILTKNYNAITTTLDWTNKVFDKSDGVDVWEQSINTSGVLQTPSKLA